MKTLCVFFFNQFQDSTDVDKWEDRWTGKESYIDLEAHNSEKIIIDQSNIGFYAFESFMYEKLLQIKFQNEMSVHLIKITTYFELNSFKKSEDFIPFSYKVEKIEIKFQKKL